MEMHCFAFCARCWIHQNGKGVTNKYEQEALWLLFTLEQSQTQAIDQKTVFTKAKGKIAMHQKAVFFIYSTWNKQQDTTVQ